MHFHLKAEGLSFSAEEIDVSHVVHAFSFGNRPSPRRQKTLARLHPGGLAPDWADKLQGQDFMSPQPEFTHEHFMQIVRTTLEPVSGLPQSQYDAYEYTVHSHSYISEVDFAIPAAKFSFQPAAMQACTPPPCALWAPLLPVPYCAPLSSARRCPLACCAPGAVPSPASEQPQASPVLHAAAATTL